MELIIVAIVALLIIHLHYLSVISNELVKIHGNSIEIYNEIKSSKTAIVDLRNDVQEIQYCLEEFKNKKS